jgi:hypothetical protein
VVIWNDQQINQSPEWTTCGKRQVGSYHMTSKIRSRFMEHFEDPIVVIVCTAKLASRSISPAGVRDRSSP